MIMKNIPTNGLLLPTEMMNEKDAANTKIKKHPLIFLLRLSGVYFGDRKDGWFWYYFGILRAFTLCVLTTYQAGFMVYVLITWDKPEGKVASTIFLLSWKIQASLSIMFLIYWQFNGHLNYLFSTVPWPSTATQNLQTQQSIKRTLIVFSVSMAIFLQTFVLLGYFVATENHDMLLSDMRVLDSYIIKPLRYMSIMVFYLGANIWLIVLIFYVLITMILHGKFLTFNQELEEISHDNVDQRMDEQLLDKYTKHIQMARMVRSVDTTFEVYTFAMIGLNIPTTIFSLISFFTAESKEIFFFILPAPIFCCFQMIGLTAIPARVHTAIQEVRNILFNNSSIWRPYEEKTYQIASIFVSHVDHANLGISVWGFAVVTKPLILTTISLTITYFTILLQLRLNKNETVNSNGFMNVTKLHF